MGITWNQFSLRLCFTASKCFFDEFMMGIPFEQELGHASATAHKGPQAMPNFQALMGFMYVQVAQRQPEIMRETLVLQLGNKSLQPLLFKPFSLFGALTSA